MKKVLFIDRDGTLIIEPPIDFQVDSLEKLEFYPGVFRNLSKIANELDYELVMVTNQDGLGTESFPFEDFIKPQEKMLKAFENEGILFSDILIDKSFEYENLPTRKPGTGMMAKYIYGNYDLENSYVIGDRSSDVQLAVNLGCRAVYLNQNLNTDAALSTSSWADIYQFLKSGMRKAKVYRKTNETEIEIEVNIDGSGKAEICTGLHFFDHMLEQIARHGNMDLKINVNGDLAVDEHHTIEDTAIVLGEAIVKALGKKKGIERYGFLLPMDDCLAQVAIDFGGRPWLVWDVQLRREKIGDVPAEMFFHFFKSFTDSSKSNLNIKAEGDNEHHKIESVFKAFAKAIKMAVNQSDANYSLPSTKGSL
ncbi:bifunctional histidinol-phosphatase/imidazoleglycerol-phosphate dehydratase [Chryseobacterium indologenes]|uniref:bifunctional histidinol-phosphatase/imidazoleglycerol-phosphate dehydratase HisB n=1 Tax=Chryseobacterium indologenes TaxID=253 RepID=UPI000BFD38B5|nr:bifunctional histidinol-phosphatase/imidazoleglycerol-phosphate dehydratase HisB [Chryseobacterium indologenes]ATN05158.1 bifunctional histidinol-phosphatase/imidazoleglycerol-phosphate dehydratase [Chryseobacterium indologenes]AYY86088.1 bifunctional histidinol-phosphatase/imidazoleglycerol-phosphate dehydratase HisB [Chryseobacterium indologenes]QIX82987.1 bifunctional histidinol-phosphatase/imidazoleglycerol-phosphate dehydratase HisB [Chryseobacterium indologenes]TLX24647.1 bifunctional 